MIRLWRRFIAWLNEPDVRVIGGQWPEPWPSAEECRRAVEILIRSGASPRAVEIAQRVWAEAHTREVLSQMGLNVRPGGREEKAV